MRVQPACTPDSAWSGPRGKLSSVASQRLEDLLIAHAPRLIAFVRKHATTLLAYEAVEDLMQGVHVRCVEQQASFVYRSEPEFLAWAYAIVRGHIADRHDYWSALKRRSGRVLRYTMSQGSEAGRSGVQLPPGSRTGPGTFAERRELLAIATRALAALPTRDQQLVQWHSEKVSLEDQASRLNITYAAAQKAGLRALERFRKTFELLTSRS